MPVEHGAGEIWSGDGRLAGCNSFHILFQVK